MSGVTSFLTGSRFFPLLLTLAVYLFAVWLQRKTKVTLLNPILISALLIIPILLFLKIPVEAYQKGTEVLSFLLTPATICLALSLYEQMQKLKSGIAAILIGIAAGTVTSLGTVLGLCLLFRLDSSLSVSLLPKSVTTAIGLALSEEGGGIASLTAAVITLTGLLGNVFGSLLCRIFHISDPIARGVAYGTASHVIGTSRAIEESSLTGAVSSLSLSVAGLLTAVLFPFVRALLL